MIYEYHEVANIFPLLQGDEYESLKRDIQENGLIEPIWLHDNLIIDGRNRYRACLDTGTEPRFREWSGAGSLVSFVVSLNLHRRHLTSSQRAILSTDVERLIAKEIAELEHIRKQQQNNSTFQLIEKSVPRNAVEEAAKILGTNRQYVSDAKELNTKAPDLAEEVRQGTKTIPQAKKELRKIEHDQQRDSKFTIPVPEKAKDYYTLYCANAESLPIENETVNLIVTSPPYNLGSGNWPMGGEGRQPRENGIGYEDQIEESKYQEWQLSVFNELYRVAKQGASFFYNHKVRQVAGKLIHPMDWIRSESNPWILRQEIVWDRGATHNHSATLFWPYDERIYWMTKGKPALPEHPIGLPSVLRLYGPTKDTWHPAPFIGELPYLLLNAVGNQGDVVLDPFAGSCTTVKEAIKLGLYAIGVDNNQDYLDRAEKEIWDVLSSE